MGGSGRPARCSPKALLLPIAVGEFRIQMVPREGFEPPAYCLEGTQASGAAVGEITGSEFFLSRSMLSPTVRLCASVETTGRPGIVHQLDVQPLMSRLPATGAGVGGGDQPEVSRV